jgi:tetratricopeptide (TPR) repeat protein
MKLSQTIAERNKSAMEAEEQGELDQAISLYEQNIKEPVADQFAYNRLMILYRKLKAYKEELRVIKKGIQVFKEQGKQVLQNNIARKKNKSELEKLSNAFMKGTGLIDRRGNQTHIPEPVNKWMKRQVVVEKKIKGK